MNIFSFIFLGILQGLTEFLPVSSSGHLVLAQSLMPSFTQPGVLFDVVLHLATSFAVLVYFRERILKYTLSDVVLLAVGTIPAFIVGFFFKDFIETLFLSVKVVGVGLLVTAIFNFMTDRAYARRESISKIDAFLIGVFQAVAIVPGISRSGSTIFAGTNLGVRRETAASFSFILSIPAIMGASFLEFVTRDGGVQVPFANYLFGGIFAFLSALLAIYIVINLLSVKRFRGFSIYCLVLGIIALLVL